MATNKITKEEYLDKDFDYSKLTMPELRQIMSENNVEDIPPLTALKSVILESYKKNIHGRIDYLKKNFSTENLFQNQRRRRATESPAKNVTFTNEDDTSNLKSEHNKIEVRINKSKANDSLSKGPCSEDAASNTSELNSTSFSSLKKHRQPFVAISQSRDNVEKSNVRPEDYTCSKGKSLRAKIFLSLFFLFCIYCKFFCPYCKPGMRFCINIPPHSRLVNDEIVCDEGYRLVRGIATICVLDNKKEADLAFRAGSIIRMLEYLRGDFKYGFAKSDKIRLSVLTSDQKLLAKLAESPRIVIENDIAQAVSYKVSFRVFMKFYFLFLVKIAGIFFLLAIFIKILLNRRRQAHALNQQAISISKDILDILNRQIVISLKSSQFRGYVYEEQMKDALEIKDSLWPYVKSIVEKNSNVQKEADENGKVFWKWIGPVMIKRESFE